jgi:hypothetical protein
VKLGKDANDNCAMLSEAKGEKLRKYQAFLSGMNGLKSSRVEITNKKAHYFVRYQGYCSI